MSIRLIRTVATVLGFFLKEKCKILFSLDLRTVTFERRPGRLFMIQQAISRHGRGLVFQT